MPISKRWSRFTWDNLDSVPEEAGTYELGYANGNIAYNGSTNNLRGRLRRHKRTPKMSQNARYFRYELAGFFEDPRDMEAYHSQKYEERRGHLPPKQQRAPRRRSLFDLL